MAQRVLVVGGSEEYVGAVYLAAIAALRSGAESVVVMAPEKVAWALNALSPDLMTRKLPGGCLSSAHRGEIDHYLETADVLLLGNGAGVRDETASLMRSLMALPIAKVADADALKVLRDNDIQNAILTPNEGEWAFLCERNDIAALLARGNVIVKKGDEAEILSGKERRPLPEANPGLAKAGMGDVLAGLCAGFLAQGLTLLEAAERAVEIGSQAARALTEQAGGYYFLASELAREVENSRARGLK